jgi:parvulin-like peptidyl-prolyl isomerase
MERQTNNRASQIQNVSGGTSGSSRKGRSQKGIFIGAILVIILVVVVGVVTSSSSPAGSSPVAIVNGEEITWNEFNQRVDRTLKVFDDQGVQVNEQTRIQIEDQILNQLINELIILGIAHDQGITATREEIDVAIERDLATIGVTDPTEEELSDLLGELSLTEDKYRENMERLVIINNYLTSSVSGSVTVDEAAIEDLYNQLVANTEDAPPLDELREALEAQVRSGKRAELVESHINTLRDEASVEVFYVPGA